MNLVKFCWSPLILVHNSQITLTDRKISVKAHNTNRVNLPDTVLDLSVQNIVLYNVYFCG